MRTMHKSKLICFYAVLLSFNPSYHGPMPTETYKNIQCDIVI